MCQWTISMLILNITYLETAQTTLAWSLPSVSRTCHLWFLVSLPPSMTFNPHPEVMQPFLVPDTTFLYHPSNYSNSLEASCFPAKWLLLHKKQLLADLCGLLWSYSPSLMTWKHSSPCLHLLAMFYIKHDWTQPVLPEAVNFFSFCSSIIPTYCVSTLTFLQRWCNVPVCRHSWCRFWWRCRCFVKITCFSCPPTIVDEQCKFNVIVGMLTWKK